MLVFPYTSQDGPGLASGTALAQTQQLGWSPRQVDVFAVDRNGSLTVTWIDDDTSGLWLGTQMISPLAMNLFPPGAPVVAGETWYNGSTATTALAVDKNGCINLAWIAGNGAWNGPTAIGNAGYLPVGANLGTMQEAFGLDVFGIDSTGTLKVLNFAVGSEPLAPVQIGGAGEFPPGAALVVTGIGFWGYVFAVDKNGTLRVAWGSYPTWQGAAEVGPAGAFPPGAAIAWYPLLEGPNIKLFLIDKQGTLNQLLLATDTSEANGGGPPRFLGQIPLGPPKSFPPGAPVAAAPQAGFPGAFVSAIDVQGSLHVGQLQDGGGETWKQSAPPGTFLPGSGMDCGVYMNAFGVYVADPIGRLTVTKVDPFEFR